MYSAEGLDLIIQS